MAGFPIILWEDMSSCLPANEFLRFYLTRGAIESTRSWEAIGRSLYDYFGFLEANDLCWSDVDRGAEENYVAAYARYSFENQVLRRNTVRLRLTYICEFYDYAVARGWVVKLPYAMERRALMRSGAFFSHIDASGGTVAVRSVMPRRHRSLIKFLGEEQITRLLQAAKNPHHLMMLRLALGSGLRREELATFPRSYVFDPDKGCSPNAANVTVRLNPQDGSGMRTKGAKARTILISRKLMKDLHHYAERLRGERSANNSKGDPLPLFVTEHGEPWAGSGKGIETMVRRIGERAGIIAHPHMLRHTYATRTLVRLQRASGVLRIEPLVFLQQQLGHSSIQTTMAYLHVVNEMVDEAVLTHDAELGNWTEALP